MDNPPLERTTSTTTASPAIVIIPGAWHVQWHYQPLIDGLKGAGFEVIFVSLPSQSNTIPPTHGLEDDTLVARYQISVLAKEGYPIITLSHSYGACVCSNALEDLSWKSRDERGLQGGVVHNIYLAAFTAPVNTCLFTPFGGVAPPWVDVDKEKKTISLKDPKMGFYNDLVEFIADTSNAEEKRKEIAEVLEKCMDSLVHCPEAVCTTPITYTPYEEIESTYIVTKRDKEFILPAQEMSAMALGPTRKMKYVDAGHFPWFLKRDEVVELVTEVWKEVKQGDLVGLKDL